MFFTHALDHFHTSVLIFASVTSNKPQGSNLKLKSPLPPFTKGGALLGRPLLQRGMCWEKPPFRKGGKGGFLFSPVTSHFFGRLAVADYLICS